MKKDNSQIKNHFRSIYYAFHRIIQKLPNSIDYLWQKIEENNLNLWDELDNCSDRSINSKRAKFLIESIVHYLSLLIGGHYLPDENFDLLIKEYNKLLAEINSPVNKKKTKKNIIKRDEDSSGEQKKAIQRQERIINFLRQRDKTVVGEILMILPQVSKRTVYRDLNNLIEKGVLKKETSESDRKKIIFYKYSN